VAYFYLDERPQPQISYLCQGGLVGYIAATRVGLQPVVTHRKDNSHAAFNEKKFLLADFKLIQKVMAK